MFREIQRAREEESGFTLIELLIVIVILGILAGVVIFSVGGITDTGVEAACKTDLKTVETAVEAYRAQQKNYPPDLNPSVTVTHQFLRPSDNLPAGSQLTGNGYTIDYQGAATGEVWVNNTDGALCPTG